MKYREIVDGIFLEFPNHFIAYVGVNGTVETVHVKNTGRCKELLLPGAAALLCAGAFPQRQASSKLRVPFIPDANVGTDDFSAQRRRRFCDMQRLIAVEGYGQIRMGSTFGNLAGIRVDAAG